MALDLTAEQKEQGKHNYETVRDDLAMRQGVDRRKFLGAAAGAGAMIPLSAAVYYGYTSVGGKPVKAALIGCGDEGGVLIGEHNPQYMEFVAACDIRPFNKDRILKGDPKVPLRKGFIYHYAQSRTKDIGDNHFYQNYKKMLDSEKDIEVVVVALPLHLHAEVSIDCMNRGKHVLCEKLMAGTVADCKAMIAAAKKNNVILSIGHQRHYSQLYSHALEVVNSGVIGDIKHIRALWHRNNSWPATPEKNWVSPDLVTQPTLRDGWFPAIVQSDYDALKDVVKDYGYKSVEELIRWRAYNRTGGGLMAELGSHQLDACSIFLGKVKPLSVMGVGGKMFYGPGKNDRESDDQVFVTYEFPGKNHPNGPNKGADKDDIVVVTYSSLNTNGFEQYGECLMGSRGTMVVESEKDVYLFKEKQPGAAAETDARKTNVAVTTEKSGKPVIEASSTWGGPGASAVKADGAAGPPVSRGYREEMEHFAVCVRKWNKSQGYATNADGKYAQELPRCHGEVAMADAILALTANMAMKTRQRIEYDPKWFASGEADVPETKYGAKSATA